MKCSTVPLVLRPDITHYILVIRKYAQCHMFLVVMTKDIMYEQCSNLTSRATGYTCTLYFTSNRHTLPTPPNTH